MPTFETDRLRSCEKNPGIFKALAKRVESEEKIELDREEVRALCESYEALHSMLSRVTRVSDLTQRQLRDRHHVLQSEVLEIRRANSALTDLDSEKNDVLALAAHDLRSPLATIHSLAEAVESLLPSGVDPSVTEFLGDIRALSEQASGLITSILDGYRAAEGRLIPKPAPTCSRELAEDLSATWRSTADLKEIEMRTAFDPDEPAFELDTDLFRRVADNLVSNALKYSPRGGSILISFSYAGELLRMSVRDNGPGISESDQANLFKRFSRLSAPATGGEQSEGLGLALSARILTVLGGEVTYESAHPHGSIFHVEIPCPPAVV